MNGHCKPKPSGRFTKLFGVEDTPCSHGYPPRVCERCGPKLRIAELEAKVKQLEEQNAKLQPDAAFKRTLRLFYVTLGLVGLSTVIRIVARLPW